MGVAGAESVDNFDYPPGSPLVGLSGGNGFEGAWSQNAETFFDPEGSGASTFLSVATGPLEYPGLEVPGNHVVFEGGGNGTSARFETAKRKLAAPFESGEIVFSFLMRVSEPAATSYADVQLIGSAHNIRVHIDGTGELYVEGVPTGKRIRRGQSHLVCGRVALSGDEMPDRLLLWLDPDLGDFGPADFEDVSKDYGAITGVRFEAHSFQDVEWDAIRVAPAPVD
ncbi:MAG: hypothetical protein SNJ52_00505 [Verrucomicrobiia bacterium]